MLLKSRLVCLLLNLTLLAPSRGLVAALPLALNVAKLLLDLLDGFLIPSILAGVVTSLVSNIFLSSVAATGLT